MDNLFQKSRGLRKDYFVTKDYSVTNTRWAFLNPRNYIFKMFQVTLWYLSLYCQKHDNNFLSKKKAVIHINFENSTYFQRIEISSENHYPVIFIYKTESHHPLNT